MVKQGYDFRTYVSFTPHSADVIHVTGIFEGSNKYVVIRYLLLPLIKNPASPRNRVFNQQYLSVGRVH